MEQIISVDFKNIFFRGYASDLPEEETIPEERPMVEVLGASSNKGAYNAPVITELYVVSNQLNELFSQAGCRRNAVLHGTEIRDYVTKYVTMNELKKGNFVKLDPHLHHAVYGKGNEEKETANWDKVFGAIQAKMSPAYSIQFPGQSQPIIKKVKLTLNFLFILFLFSYSSTGYLTVAKGSLVICISTNFRQKTFYVSIRTFLKWVESHYDIRIKHISLCNNVCYT